MSSLKDSERSSPESFLIVIVTANRAATPRPRIKECYQNTLYMGSKQKTENGEGTGHEKN